ncbi:MAG: hypothetical protein PHU32_05830 [Candidatus ainarchaeum sp.]|jgi:hypothetical protein|nr:hypothetical protein [Candidatus ainarchaeum sp.]
MEVFITILIIGFVIYLIAKNSNSQKKQKKTEVPIDIKVTTSFGTGTSFEQEKFKPISQDTNGGWILNPGAKFKLTLINVDEQIASEVRNLLDNDEIRDYRKDDKIMALFAKHNIKVKEIESYKRKYKKQYLSKIEELKENSKEWQISGEKDREDLLIEFRKSAISTIYERADCDLEALFEYEPKEITADDELIQEYGFENLQTYLRYADKLDKVRVIPNDNYSRPMFEKLWELGLAQRGNEISKEEILMTLTLKDLNSIAQNPDKQYNRKKQAVEYILNLPDLDDKVGKFISLRELFKLQPLPEKFNKINLDEISKTWKYHAEEVKLLMDTFRNSYYSWRDLKDKEYVKGYSVEPLDKENPCPCAKERSEKKYPKSSPPKVPFHIGCNCFLNQEYD